MVKMPPTISPRRIDSTPRRSVTKVSMVKMLGFTAEYACSPSTATKVEKSTSSLEPKWGIAAVGIRGNDEHHKPSKDPGEPSPSVPGPGIARSMHPRPYPLADQLTERARRSE